MVDRDVIRHPGGVAVLPIDGQEVVLVRQYRVAIGDHVLEIPAGKLDGSDEPPPEGARRELEEEIGFAPTTLISLGRMLPSPGYTDEVIHLFAADGILPSDAASKANRRPDGVEEEHSEIVRMTMDEAFDGIESGMLTDAKTQVALLRWTTLRRRL